MAAGMTVKELFHACAEQIRLGNEDRIVQISNDDEGNGYHTLFYTFAKTEDNAEIISICELHDDYKPDEVALLG